MAYRAAAASGGRAEADVEDSVRGLNISRRVHVGAQDLPPNIGAPASRTEIISDFLSQPTRGVSLDLELTSG